MTDICGSHITKSFDGKAVLRDFSFVLPRGQVTCLMGVSGSGKTTLARLLLGSIGPDAGSIAGVPEKKAAVFQEDRLAENFTVLRNVLLPVGNARKEEAMRLLRVLGLETEYKTRVSALSGGMKRRVALARALICDAELVILDEPFKGLDEKTRAQAIELCLERLKGKTVLLITHDPAEAGSFGGRVITLENGIE